MRDEGLVSIQVIVMFSKLSKHKSLLLVLYITMPVSISLTGCSNLSYVNKSALRKMGYTKTSRGLPTKNYGALALETHTPENSQDNSRLILLGKQKSFFFAETMVHQNKNDKSSLIDKSFLSIGADRKKKGGMVQLRLVY